MGLLVGTDFNIGGIKGIGPKNSLKLVKKYGKDFEGLFEEAGWSRHYDMDWKIVFDTIKHMPVTDDYELKWNNVNRDKIIGLLVEKHEFSRERIEKNLDELEEETKKGKQKGLGDFF